MPCSSTPRIRSPRAAGSRSACSGSPAASSASARPTSAAPQQLDYASLVDFKTGEVVWFNVVQAGSQVPGIKFGDLRTPQGAAQMVERLLGRMKPGRGVRQRAGGALMCVRCLESPAARCWSAEARPRPRCTTGVAEARIRPQDMVPLVGAGYRADRPRREGPVEGNGAGRGGDRRLQPADHRTRS